MALPEEALRMLAISQLRRLKKRTVVTYVVVDSETGPRFLRFEIQSVLPRELRFTAHRVDKSAETKSPAVFCFWNDGRWHMEERFSDEENDGELARRLSVEIAHLTLCHDNKRLAENFLAYVGHLNGAVASLEEKKAGTPIHFRDIMHQAQRMRMPGVFFRTKPPKSMEVLLTENTDDGPKWKREELKRAISYFAQRYNFVDLEDEEERTTAAGATAAS